MPGAVSQMNQKIQSNNTGIAFQCYVEVANIFDTLFHRIVIISRVRLNFSAFQFLLVVRARVIYEFSIFVYIRINVIV